MSKDRLVAVRLTDAEVQRLDSHTKGQLNRSQLIRLLITDFLEKTEKQQRDCMRKRMPKKKWTHKVWAACSDEDQMGYVTGPDGKALPVRMWQEYVCTSGDLFPRTGREQMTLDFCY